MKTIEKLQERIYSTINIYSTLKKTIKPTTKCSLAKYISSASFGGITEQKTTIKHPGNKNNFMIQQQQCVNDHE